jgi:hypothetical protein
MHLTSLAIHALQMLSKTMDEATSPNDPATRSDRLKSLPSLPLARSFY